MNNRPVEQALATLLPTHASEIPPELLSLAQSLVAQSRSYATSLKPEEEIARPFACAEIACRRYGSMKLESSKMELLTHMVNELDWHVR
jgi:origin recognition complex subunit 6